MPSFELEFEVYCKTCGAGLCGQSEAVSTFKRGMPAVRVEPCTKCLASERSEGYDEGHSDGYDKGLQEGAQSSAPAEAA